MIHILAVSDEQALRGRLPELDRVDMLISCGDLPPSYTEVLIHRYAPQHRVMTYGNHDEIFFHDKNPSGLPIISSNEWRIVAKRHKQNEGIQFFLVDEVGKRFPVRYCEKHKAVFFDSWGGVSPGN